MSNKIPLHDVLKLLINLQDPTILRMLLFLQQQIKQIKKLRQEKQKTTKFPKIRLKQFYNSITKDSHSTIKKALKTMVMLNFITLEGPGVSYKQSGSGFTLYDARPIYVRPTFRGYEASKLVLDTIALVEKK